MSEQIDLIAELREDKGKGASRRLRRLQNKVPGIVYGGSGEAVAVSLVANDLAKAMQDERFYSQILNVKTDGQNQQVVVRDLQRHPATNRVQHIDLLRVSADRSIDVHIPLHFINEENCAGVKVGGGSIAHNLIEVEVSCLPGNLPEFIEVDVLDLELGQSLHLSDLKLPEGVAIVALGYGEDRDIAVVSVQTRRGGADDEVAEEEGDAEVDAAAGDADAEEGAADDAG